MGFKMIYDLHIDLKSIENKNELNSIKKTIHPLFAHGRFQGMSS